MPQIGNDPKQFPPNTWTAGHNRFRLSTAPWSWMRRFAESSMHFARFRIDSEK